MNEVSLDEEDDGKRLSKTYESAKLPYLEPEASLLLIGFYFYKDVAVLQAIYVSTHILIPA